MQTKLTHAQQSFKYWKATSHSERAALLHKLKEVLTQHRMRYATLMTQEMHKPITQALAEIDKCGWLCDYYVQNAESFLKMKHTTTEARKSFVTYEPLGVILGVMPWNFPFWQVFRFAVPALMAGNTALLKHASNVPQCSLAIEEVFTRGGLPEGAFRSLLVRGEAVDRIIEDPRVKAVSL